MSTQTTITLSEARRARELAEQRLALAFDAKTNALVELQAAQLAEYPSTEDLAAASEAVRRVREVYAQARAELEQAVKAERDLAPKRSRVTWLEPRP